MNGLEQILAIAAACIVSAGGIGGIIWLSVKFSVNSIADALAKKYELRLNKELERYKAGVENKIYISKAKFDTEFQLYRQLSRSFTQMVKESWRLFPPFTKDSRDDLDPYKGLYKNALNAVVDAQDELSASAAFISAEMYESFFEIEKLCKRQLSDFEDFRLSPNAERNIDLLNEGFVGAYKRTEEIKEKYDSLMEILRKYISRLDVIE